MTTARDALLMLRANCETLAADAYARVADQTTGDAYTRAIDTGRYGTYTAIAKAIESDLALIAQEPTPAPDEANRWREQLVEIGRLFFAVGRGDPQAIRRYLEIIAPYVPPDELAQYDPLMTRPSSSTPVQ